MKLPILGFLLVACNFAHAQQAVPVAQRAALQIALQTETEKFQTIVGNVVWRLDNVSRGLGQPLAIGVRAEIDLPEAKLKAVMLIKKNTDEKLPASHLIEIRFTHLEGSTIPNVAQIQAPQMRYENARAGDTLEGVPAPIQKNYFLVGLSRSPLSMKLNKDLLLKRSWFDIPILLEDKRIAKITFEKNSLGERILEEALQTWEWK